MKCKVYEIGQGDRFSLGGVIWLTLDHEEAGARALIEDLMGEMAFDEGGSKDWREASLNEYMNTDLLKKLQNSCAGESTFIKAEVNLKAIDGAEDYGEDKCFLAPLTDEQYGMYADIIPKAKESWWLVTPYSCNEFYAGPTYSHYVRFVRPDGSRDGCMPDAGLYGVRPNAVISLETEVEIISSSIDENIQKIKDYNSPIIITDIGRELASGLKKIVEETSAVCSRIPAVINGRESVKEAHAQTDAVTFYEMIIRTELGRTEARTYISVLGEIGNCETRDARLQS